MSYTFLILTHSHKVSHIFLTRATSDVKDLNGGQFYYLEVLHVETTGSDFLGVGITLPDGTTLHPINKTYLWREKPGNCLDLKDWIGLPRLKGAISYIGWLQN